MARRKQGLHKVQHSDFGSYWGPGKISLHLENAPLPDLETAQYDSLQVAVSLICGQQALVPSV